MLPVDVAPLRPALAAPVQAPRAATAAPAPTAAPRARVALPADDAAHPGSRTEWWYVHAIDPRTGRAVILTIFAAPLPVVGGFLYGRSGVSRWLSLSLPRAHTGPGVDSSAASLVYDAGRRVWRLDSDAGGYVVHLVLSSARPGPTAGPLRFGSEWMSWTVPVATSTVDGSVTTPSGATIAIHGWRGYHDHNWGAFSLESTAYRGWEWAAVHEPGGRSEVLGGVVDLAGRFQGVIARVGPRRTRLCRPAIALSRWTTSGGFRLPLRLAATCGGRTTRFAVTRPYVASLGGYALSESVGRTAVAGSAGFVEHLARR